MADAKYDTNLLIAGGSVQSTIVAQDDAVFVGNNDTKIVDVLANDSSTAGTLSVTHINGTAVVAGDTVTLATGQQITLNADGTFTVVGDGDAETVLFQLRYRRFKRQHRFRSGRGSTGPLFLWRALGSTLSRGPCLIETLQAGAQILTRDAGVQTLRWIGRRTVRATGPNRPIRIKAGQFGATKDLLLSPQHQVLIGGWWAELFFGEDEVLVKAKTPRQRQGPCALMMSFHRSHILHMLFDDHQIVTANGVGL